MYAIGPLRATTIERTLLDLASIGTDIGPIAHEALAKHLTTQRELSDTADRQRGNKGAKALRRVANEPHLRSRLERRFLPFLAAHELPQPLTNQRIGPYTVDCLYPDHQLVIEVDEDAHRSAWAFEHDRARDRYLVTKGFRLMRVTKTSMADGNQLAQELSEALASPSP